MKRLKAERKALRSQVKAAKANGKLSPEDARTLQGGTESASVRNERAESDTNWEIGSESTFNSQLPILIRVEGARVSFLSDENWRIEN